MWRSRPGQGTIESGGHNGYTQPQRRGYEATHSTRDGFNDGDLARVRAARRRCCRAAEIAEGATRRNLDVRLIQRQAAGWKSLVGEQSQEPPYLHRQWLLHVARLSF